MGDNATATATLDDLKTQFYAIMEQYPTVYANFKVNPDLPSARDAHDKTEAQLTALYRRMFSFQADVETAAEQHEDAVNDLTSENSKLNALLARRGSALNSKNAFMTSTFKESFINGGLGDDADSSTIPTPSATQISLVAEAKSIEKTTYIYAISRIVYLSLGIIMITYFILQTVGAPDSTILSDAKKMTSATMDGMNRFNDESAKYAANAANSATMNARSDKYY
jgi:hypothetical protein